MLPRVRYSERRGASTRQLPNLNERSLWTLVEQRSFGFLGATYVDMGQYEKAIEFLNKSILVSPRDPNLFSWYFEKSVRLFFPSSE